MSNLQAASGLAVPTQQIDLNTAPVLRQRTSSGGDGVGLTKEQFEQFQKAGGMATPELPARPPDFSSPPAGSMTAAETYAPNPAFAPAPAPAAQAPSPPPVLPTDTSRAQDRINQLYGRSKSAEERAADLEAKLMDLQRRLDEGYRQPAPPVYQAQPAHVPYGYEAPSYAPAQPQVPSDTVSRSELLHLLKAQQQALADQSALSQAHTVARLEAEREFPDVYQNPELRALAGEVWSRDRALQQDPLGVKKAALMARGLSVADIRVQAASAASQSVRKEAMSGLGQTVPSGTSQTPDQSHRLSQALAFARSTGRIEDFVAADQIRRGNA